MKTLRREECLRSASALRLGIRLEDTQEYRPLITEDCIQARSSDAHPFDEIVNRHAVVTLRPEHLCRLFQRVALIEAARSSPWLGCILKHLVQYSLTAVFSPGYILTEQFDINKGGSYNAGAPSSFTHKF